MIKRLSNAIGVLTLAVSVVGCGAREAGVATPPPLASLSSGPSPAPDATRLPATRPRRAHGIDQTSMPGMVMPQSPTGQ